MVRATPWINHVEEEFPRARTELPKLRSLFWGAKLKFDLSAIGDDRVHDSIGRRLRSCLLW